jgi:hypothetical protein
MAKIRFRQEAVEALKATVERLGISMEETANNAVLVYRDRLSDSIGDHGQNNMIAIML